MVNFEAIMQLKAFARQDGALMSLLWVASFACLLYLPQLPLANVLALSTPFFVGWRLVKFRNYALDGKISFGRAYCYSVYTFFYASAIFAVAQFLYFRFLDNGLFASMLNETMKALAPYYRENGIPQKELNASIGMAASLTPIQWAFMFMMQNLFIGAVAGLPIAALCKKTGTGSTSGLQR